ncbi:MULTISPECIES: AfsR/SARP family transcriptional regulator [Streptomyces]|uniref:BTAD domain-containing putative transcriptional regulator n=1 Tax=Streptomyces heilongjiangensis TaxID=945052 RepID=A0ABW1B4M9_9ACTN|nr:MULTISPECIES: AfsR/SARP family transcriptional regulator [Streptomyces]MDC2948250.1 AfsR/SARP family transcriptional regulator [Streptomyces heilongjiangensis]
MEVRVLGPLVAQLDHTSVVPSAAKPRQVLALLALHAGQVVTVSTLLDELWGDAPPRTAPATLQTYIRQLRRRLATALGPTAVRGPKDVLCTRYGGYALDVAGAYDATEFQRLSAAGQTALREGSVREASVLLHQALALWRGPALADVQIGRALEVETVRLEETRLGALDARIEADLRLGRHAALLGELTALAAQHPLHETVHAQLMLALYRCGRPSHALGIYQRLRQCLIRELALEPSTRLQRLHQAILRADPVLESPEPAVSDGPASRVRPLTPASV